MNCLPIKMRSPSSLNISSSSKRPTSKEDDDDDNTNGCWTKKNKGAAATGLKRGPWTAEEDELLSDYIKREGEGRWRTLPKKAGLLRCGKSCRLRWMNYLRPSVKRGHISDDEEDLILRLHRLLGNRWSLIAGRIPGRTDNEIKNYWNTHLSKKLISQGIDPKTHKPISPLLIIPTTKNNPLNTITNTKHHHQYYNSINNPMDYPKSPLLPNNYLPSSSASTDLYVVPDHHQNGLLENVVSYSSHNIEDNNNINQELIQYGSKKTSIDDQYNLNINNITSTNCSTSNVDHDHHQEINYGEYSGDHNDNHGMMMANCYADEAFSSFLNSLINDDTFNITHNNNNHHHHELDDCKALEEANPIIMINSDDHTLTGFCAANNDLCSQIDKS